MEDKIGVLFAELNKDINIFYQIEKPEEASQYIFKMRENFTSRCDSLGIKSYFRELKSKINEAFLDLSDEQFTEIKIELDANKNYADEPDYDKLYLKAAKMLPDGLGTLNNASAISYALKDLIDVVYRPYNYNLSLLEQLNNLRNVMPTNDDIEINK